MTHPLVAMIKHWHIDEMKGKKTVSHVHRAGGLLHDHPPELHSHLVKWGLTRQDLFKEE